MKKLFFIFPILLIVSGCGWFGVSDNEVYNSDSSCLDSCAQKLSMICSEDVSMTCTSICQEQDGDIRNCLMGLENCEDLVEHSLTCYSASANGLIDDPLSDNSNQAPNCQSVCLKYQTCASYGEDVTASDLQEAYDSCLVECPSWSVAGLVCMDEKEIKAPLDCMQLSVCGAQEYKY
ncbi:MAG: hypothetical protein UX09_C0037G0012 [Candidatus Uhrbacteria bacterium GW2011_GWE2_45_35]|uniref:Lipoprotein n=1 Tax=Candidatus Uhrbacteria bacterium GW2011_GWE2_45_35 TaxID=1618993 RepID=A0A0G1MF62_9BACT|nr:MAG: hypothetical protein UX09_C0037G0012 [Candidatus Uhrbacteria bacterium GW2011_GWE2_45_35]HBR80973.1 hypothetical protein [Candidatus Uhrbacteria bacterium]HCU31922.1 hypothetical protein [Candidatus Uhrbacteria bacterium]